MALPDQTSNLSYLDNVDRILLDFSPPLTDDSNSNPDLDEMTASANQFLTTQVRSFYQNELDEKSLLLRVGYPSVTGGSSICIPAGENDCYSPDVFKVPAPVVDNLNVDYTEQASAYQAVFRAVNDLTWVDGVVSQGFYAPAVLHDYSISIHGKPADDVLQFWFTQLSP
jgi:hypothetical protein